MTGKPMPEVLSQTCRLKQHSQSQVSGRLGPDHVLDTGPLSCIPGPHPFNARSTPPPVVTIIVASKHCQVSLRSGRVESPSVENQWFKSTEPVVSVES